MRIQLVAVGLDILRNAQASSSVRLCDSMVTPNGKLKFLVGHFQP